VAGSFRPSRGLVLLLPLVLTLACRTGAPPERLAGLAPELGQLLLVGFTGTQLDPEGGPARQ
jgi:hypothetical protein